MWLVSDLKNTKVVVISSLKSLCVANIQQWCVTSGRGGLLQVGVGYFSREFRTSRGGLLRGGLLLGYSHHGLRWVTSEDLQKESS